MNRNTVLGAVALVAAGSGFVVFHDDNYSVRSCGTITRESDWIAPVVVTDTQYGPTQISPRGVCPGIPKDFLKTYMVATGDEFDTALERVKPGEAIIFRNGTYDFSMGPPSIISTGVPSIKWIDAAGTTKDQVYILPQTRLGVDVVTSMW